MISKLTLSIDDSVIEHAKNYAKQKRKSLSAIVENYLLSLTSTQDDDEISPEIKKMMGIIHLPEDFDYKSEIAKEIEEKYKK